MSNRTSCELWIYPGVILEACVEHDDGRLVVDTQDHDLVDDLVVTFDAEHDGVARFVLHLHGDWLVLQDPTPVSGHPTRRAYTHVADASRDTSWMARARRPGN